MRKLPRPSKTKHDIPVKSVRVVYVTSNSNAWTRKGRTVT